jgi:hypothetical protein
MHLLDVNVLIALIDETHTHHDMVVDWFVDIRHTGWATCPLVENGFIRIVGHPNYPGGPQSTYAARALLAKLCQSPGHQFWPDTISLLERTHTSQLPASKHLTDYYLLMLAIKNEARFATLDQRIETRKILNGDQSIHVIGTTP